MEKLSRKQQAWIDYYKQGFSCAEAARKAGYSVKSAAKIGSDNYIKLHEYIKDRDNELEQARVADMQEINEFWSEVMRNNKADMKDRLKASELRARSMGAFLDRVEHSGKMLINNPFAGLTTEELRKLAGDG